MLNAVFLNATCSNVRVYVVFWNKFGRLNDSSPLSFCFVLLCNLKKTNWVKKKVLLFSIRVV